MLTSVERMNERQVVASVCGGNKCARSGGGTVWKRMNRGGVSGRTKPIGCPKAVWPPCTDLRSPLPWHLTCSMLTIMAFPRGSVVKNLPANAGKPGFNPWSGRSPGEGNGNPFQYSCLGNPMNRGARRAVVHGVAKSQTRLSLLSFLSVLPYALILLLALFKDQKRSPTSAFPGGFPRTQDLIHTQLSTRVR